MSGNVPYCPSRSGIQILTGYSSTYAAIQTITFSTPFKSNTEPFVFLTIDNIGNVQNNVNIMLSGPASDSSFGVIKRYDRFDPTYNPFNWVAIGESATITSGNVPVCQGQTGMQILTGYDSRVLQTGTVTFDTNYPFSSPPNVFFSIIPSSPNFVYSMETKGRPTTTNFTFNKHFGNIGESSDPFYWMAIGNRAATGNVPVTPLLAGAKIQYGKYATNVQNGTITFSHAFTGTPNVFVTIESGSFNTIYTATVTAVSDTSFNFQKRYDDNEPATSEDIWWLAIGV